MPNCLSSFLHEHEKVVSVKEIPVNAHACIEKWIVVTDRGRVFIMRYEGYKVFTVEESIWKVREDPPHSDYPIKTRHPGGMDISV